MYSVCFTPTLTIQRVCNSSGSICYLHATQVRKCAKVFQIFRRHLKIFLPQKGDKKEVPYYGPILL